MRLCSTGFVLLLILMEAASPVASADESASNRRRQAVLRLNGKFLPNGGGYAVSDIDPDGPGADMRSIDEDRPVRGTLEKGDVITKVGGKSFTDRREFFDRLNAAALLAVKLRRPVK